jgi:hypothetical protein
LNLPVENPARARAVRLSDHAMTAGSGERRGAKNSGDEVIAAAIEPCFNPRQ